MPNNLDKLNPNDFTADTIKAMLPAVLTVSECLLFDDGGKRTFDIKDAAYLALTTEAAVRDFEMITDVCEHYGLLVPKFEYDLCPGGLFICSDEGIEDVWKWVGRLSNLKKIFALDFPIED